MNLIPGIEMTSDALKAEKMRMDLIAQNIANANTTRDADGEAYKRKMVAFETYMNPNMPGDSRKLGLESVRISGIEEDDSPGARVYNPSHPHADEEGMLTLSNVKVATEMVDLISASRAYQANLNVIKTSRQLATQTMQIGKK